MRTHHAPPGPQDLVARAANIELSRRQMLLGSLAALGGGALLGSSCTPTGSWSARAPADVRAGHGPVDSGVRASVGVSVPTM